MIYNKDGLERYIVLSEKSKFQRLCDNILKEMKN